MARRGTRPERNAGARDPFAPCPGNEAIGVGPGIDAQRELVLTRQAVHQIGHVRLQLERTAEWRHSAQQLDLAVERDRESAVECIAWLWPALPLRHAQLRPIFEREAGRSQ